MNTLFIDHTTCYLYEPAEIPTPALIVLNTSSGATSILPWPTSSQPPGSCTWVTCLVGWMLKYSLLVNRLRLSERIPAEAQDVEEWAS